jgi:undecaprenyl-diphosphatase
MKLRIKVLLAILAIFLSLAVLAQKNNYFQIDLTITRAIQQITSPWFMNIMEFVSAIGYLPYIGIIMGAITFVLFIQKQQWGAIVSSVSAVLITVIGLGIKLLVERPRPGEDLVIVMRRLNEYSFPSGHVLLYSVYVGFLFYLTYTKMKKSLIRNCLLAIELFFIIAIAPSRIYLGAHWASDTLGAYILGSLWLLLTIYCYQWGKKKYETKSNH